MSAFAAKDFNIKNNTQNYFHVDGATGNIGIGTTTPQGGFVVTNGNVGIGTWNPGNLVEINGGNVGIGTNITNHAMLEITGQGSKKLFRVNDSGQNDTTPFEVISSGNVGIGTSDPLYSLSVNGTVKVAGIMDIGNSTYTAGVNPVTLTNIGNAGSMLTLANSGGPFMQFQDSGSKNWSMGIEDNTTAFIFAEDRANGVTMGTERVRFAAGGNVGIGTTTPQDKLIVVGGNVGIGTWTAANASLETTGLRLIGNGAAAGSVLVSSSTGIGTWMAPGTISSSAASGWSTGTGTVYNTTGSDKVGIGTTTPQGGLVVTNGNVGIGTWAPAAQIDVNGNIYVRDLNSIYFNDPAEYINSPTTGNLLLGARNTVNLVGDNNNNGSLTDAVIIFNETSTLHPLGAMLKNSNLGVGTIAPGSALGVLGGISVGEYATLSAPPGGMIVPNNVGIGTTTPQGALVVTNGNVGIGTWAPNNLFQVGINQVTVNSAGNVGIGSLTPSGILDVRGGTAAASTAGRNINLTAEASGAGGNTAGGSINLTGGVGVGTGAGGSVYISSGGNRSGSITLFTPQSAVATYGYGDITLNATGYGGAGHGGYLQLQGTNASGDGGDAVMRSGNGVAAYGNPGNVTISGGSAMFNTGGSVSITGGAGGATTGIGGNVVISGGAKQGAGRVGHLLLQSSGGNVGMGTTTPQSGFTVTSANVGIGTWTADTATLETIGLRLIGNGAAAGSVLVSSSTGIGTWMAASTLATSGAASGWSTGTGTVYNTTGSDKVGIGTTTPQGGFVVTNGNVGIGTWTTPSGLTLRSSFAYYRTTTAATATTAGQTIIGVTDTSAARTVHLATGDRAPGRVVIVKDESGGAGTNNITIDGESGETIDGAASIVISVNYGVLRVYSDGTNWFTF